MAGIADYSDLFGAVQDYTGRDDFGAFLPRFVTLAESLFNRYLRTADMESTVVLTTDESGGSELPFDYLEMRCVKDSAGKFVGNNGIFQNQGYAIKGSKIIFRPAAIADYQVSYYASLPPLSEDGENSFLAKFPRLYLMAVAREVWEWAGFSGRDAEGMAKASQAYGAVMKEIDEINKLDVRARWSNVAVTSKALL